MNAALWLATLFTFYSVVDNREVKHNVYGKRQTAKMKRLPSLFSCVYSGVKLFVFAMNNTRRYSTFCVFYLRIRRKELKIRSYLCRLPSAVNVMLNLSNEYCSSVRRGQLLCAFEVSVKRI